MYVTAFVVSMYDFNENNEALIQDYKIFDNRREALKYIDKSTNFDCYKIKKHQIEI